mmetsp:Transcript_11396/g.19224  ORF Transcript_11396/g.19224 Transcript_11396/m.19224 type:complete len:157 (-) Transcript_11396:57-527(-)
MSVERLGAGPAVPLIYAFMKKQNPALEAVLEKDSAHGKAKEFNALQSKDIIQMAVLHKDPLCLKVVDKFIEIFGNETGNTALKLMPLGGIYLIGGVTNGVRDYLLANPNKFLGPFRNKGRLQGFMSGFRVMVVNPELEVGLLGAEEKARREMLKYW